MVGSPQSFDGVNQNLSGNYCIDSPGNNTSEVIYSINKDNHIQNMKLIREIFLCKPITQWSW